MLLVNNDEIGKFFLFRSFFLFSKELTLLSKTYFLKHILLLHKKRRRRSSNKSIMEETFLSVIIRDELVGCAFFLIQKDFFL